MLKQFCLAAVLFVAGVAHGACLDGHTCLSWEGAGKYSDGANIPTAFVVTYTVWNGPKGGPYTTLYAYNGTPTQAMRAEFVQPPKAKLCFVVTATANTPDDSGVLKPATSAYSGETCDVGSLPAPTDGSIEAPTEGSIEF